MTTSIGILVILCFVEIVVFSLVLYCKKEFPWLITKSAKAPKFDESVVDKFIKNSFDVDLGWAPKPFNTGRDNTEQGVKKYSIDSDGCRSNPRFEGTSSLISLFGDSYSFGRLVNDDETWAHLLSKRMKTNIKNFSVGNYGFDQALLRVKREIDSLESEIIIINVVPETISRIHSFWKHYFEYGNILAFKPIFKIRNKSLQLHKPFIQKKQNFFEINVRQKEIAELDIFYSSKFSKDILHFPFSLSILKSRCRGLKIIKEILKGIFLGNKEVAYRNAFKVVIQKNAEHTSKLYNDNNAKLLYLELMKDFVKLCRSKNKIPIVVICPQPIDLERRSAGFRDYQEFVELASRSVEIVDLTSLIYNENKFQEYYIEGELGPHLSPKGNKLVMEYMYEYLREKHYHNRVNS